MKKRNAARDRGDDSLRKLRRAFDESALNDEEMYRLLSGLVGRGKLEEAGEIRRDPTKPRAMLLEKAREERAQREAESAQRRGLPLVGAVAAGVMTLAEQEVEDYIESPFPGDFVLRVKGESMRDAGILDGDLVVVKQQPTARDGEIVVAGIDDEATVKRFFKEADHIRLQPENDAFEPIRSTEVNVLGVVVAVLRKL